MPGDKSISHRALMLGGIAEGETQISGFLASEDCLATLRALRALGVQHRAAGGAREVRRARRRAPTGLQRRAAPLTWATPAPRCAC